MPDLFLWAAARWMGIDDETLARYERIKMQERLAEQIRSILMEAGHRDLEVQQIGEVDNAAINASEFEIWANDGNCYIVNVMRKED